MNRNHSLAIFGGDPLFERPIPKGQRFFPSWERYEAMFRDIFARQYYTNHGPLAQELEGRLASQLGVRNAMCVTNEFIGLALTGQALGLHGEVIVPAHSSIATPQSLYWTEAKPLFCDVSAKTGMLTAELVEPLLAKHRVSAILGVNPWGDACEVAELEGLADRYGIPLYFDSSHAFGCSVDGRMIGGFGAAEVISFHSDNIVGCCEGGVICTDNDELAAHIRNIRSNYGMGPPVPVVKTGNGRMSEAQAAVVLFNLGEFVENQRRNEYLFETFKAGIAEVPGLEVRVPLGVTQSNYQNLICLVNEARYGLRRDELYTVLRAENLDVGRGFCPPPYRSLGAARPSSTKPLQHTEHYCGRTIELPTNHALSEANVGEIVRLLWLIHESAEAIRRRLANAA